MLKGKSHQRPGRPYRCCREAPTTKSATTTITDRIARSGQGSNSDLDPALLANIDGKFFSGFIRARKPGA